MSEITANMVKELRERTGAGMMDCKKALNETSGDLEAALDWLRAKGIAKAANKSSRTTAEGLVALAFKDKNCAALVEVNSETDFVARNADFQTMVSQIASAALGSKGDVEHLKAASCKGVNQTVSEYISGMIAKIGENMTVRRCAVIEEVEGVVGGYLHNQVADGLGKIGVVVSLRSSSSDDELSVLARQLAMHVAATNPMAMDSSQVPSSIIEREKAILVEKNQGKPAPVLEKIVESGIRTFLKDHCLLDQAYVHDSSKSVQQVIKECESRIGSPVVLSGYVRFQLGEGIEKVQDDFAAEVAKVAASA